MLGVATRTFSLAVQVEFSFIAEPQLATRALRYLLWRRGGLVGPFALVALPLLLALIARDPAGRPIALVLAGGALMLFVLFLLAVAHRRRLTRRFFQSTSDHSVQVSMDDASVTVTTALGVSTLPWQAFERLWTGPSVVLLFYHGWRYLAFPANAVPEEALRLASVRILRP